MSSGKPRRPAGARRSAPRRRKSPESIVIAGISGNLGRLLTRRLHTDYPIIGIDKRPFDGKPKDVTHFQVDARRRRAENIFRRKDIRALVHLGLLHRPQPGEPVYREMNVRATVKLLDYCQRYDIPKVVLISAASVYGPDPTNSNFLTEDTPLAGVADYPEMQALIEWDMYAQSFFWKYPDIETVILRPVHVVGPNVRNAPTNYLRLARPPVLLGFDPMLQLLHEDDLIQAIMLSLEPGISGIFNVVGPGEVPLSVILKQLGKTSLPLPHLLARPLLKKLWRFGLSGFPPGEIAHLQYQCMVDGKLARDVLGFRPRYNLRQTILSVKEHV